VIVAHDFDELAPAKRALTVGTFDGVHLGHQRIIEGLKSTGLRSVVVTFEPHPRTLRGNRVELLTTLERRLELLEQTGVDEVVVIRFDAHFAALPPQDFADRLRSAGVELIAAGEDWRFGSRRGGDITLFEEFGIRTVTLPRDGISSSQIRSMLREGDVEDAAALLGRPADLEGIVVLGDQRGGTLGFPTANLALPADLCLPAFGIYAGHTRGARAAISIGTNPHYGGTERRIEVYLLDFEGDLYGERLVVELWERLRDEASFESEAQLVAAIEDDVARTRAAVRPS
jgi:riboflavin kinase/FMN adenylyltransferase